MEIVAVITLFSVMGATIYFFSQMDKKELDS